MSYLMNKIIYKLYQNQTSQSINEENTVIIVLYSFSHTWQN